MIQVKVKGITPQYKTVGSSGADLVLNTESSVTIEAGGIATLPTGTFVELPVGYEAQVRPRSSMSAKGVIVPVGTIDNDYRGEIKIVVINNSGVKQTFAPLERIAQLVIAPVAQVDFITADNLGETTRGENGFGSTGK